MIDLRLTGNIPSKKNQRRNTRSGMSFPSNDYVQWEKDAIKQIRVQTHKRFFEPVMLEVVIYFGTYRRADLDNRVTSILDMLVEALVLRDDKWQDVPAIKAVAEYRKNAPGAYIRITEMES